jgi:mono/diheme cytochrome c family protein
MRERLAVVVIALTLVLLVGLAGVFGVRHNPDESTEPAPPHASADAPSAPAAPSVAPANVAPPPSPPPAPASAVLRGAEVYREQRCATCHALAGAGNPRYPLDGVGARHDAEALRDWIVGTGAAAGALAGPVLRRKTAYRSLPAEDLAALVDYLAAQP